MVMAEMAEYTAEHGLRHHIHCAETREEVEGCKARHGCTPVAFLKRLGYLELPLLLAHGIWLEEEDFALLREAAELTVATCPVSNLKLASGVCPISRLKAEGIRCALGTDGAASNNNLDLWEEIKLFALLHKERSGDPTLITPQEAFYAATRAGALAQGRTDCGLLKEGMRADLLLLDISGPQWCPVSDLMSHLVYAASGSDVIMTVCDGEILYKEGEFTRIDIERVKAEAEKAYRGILRELEQ